MQKSWIVAIGCCLILVLSVMVKKSVADSVDAPCRYVIDDFTLYSLFDGHIDFPLKNIIQDDTDFDHPYFHPAAGQTVDVPINVFLLDTKTQRILFDVGLAGMFHSQTGQLPSALQAIGYSADQITAICITHLHPDHIAGLLHADGTKAFVNADLFIAQADLDYWQQSQEHPAITSLLAKIVNLYTVHPVASGQQLFDGISVFATSGHSPGHISFLCRSQQQKLLILGDIIHVPQLQFAHPGISILDDTDHVQAIATRQALLQQAAQENLIIAGVHLDSPGVGTVQLEHNDNSEQLSYRWIPFDGVLDNAK